MDKKRVYTFGNGQAEGKADMRNLLGGKGANLAEMNLIGIPVPPGFTIATDVCNEYYEVGQEKIVEMNRNAANAQKLHADQMVLSEKQNKELQNKITELNKSAENAQKLYKEQIEAMKKQHETTEKQVKMYEEQAKSFNENISKMQQTNVALQKSLTEITTQNAKSSKELADAKALATRLEEQLKQAERQSKPVGLYVVLVVLVAIILFLISN